VNDRLPYADVSIATVFVVLGVALAAYPWLEGDFRSLLIVVAGLVSVGALGVALRRPKDDVISGEIRT
jgi:hypothetical protein